MYTRLIAAALTATFAMTAMEAPAHAFGKKRLFANGGNGGSLNVVLGNNNKVGNGGNGGAILGGGGLFGSKHAHANGGNGGSLNVVIGNGNSVGNGGDGGLIGF